MPAINWDEKVTCPKCNESDWPDIDDPEIELDEHDQFDWTCDGCGHAAAMMATTVVKFAFAGRGD